MLLEKIHEKDNLFIKELKELTEEGFSTYIYGAGLGSEQVRAILEKEKIPFVGRIVDKIYYSGTKEAYCLEDVLEIVDTKINLIVAHRGFRKEKLVKYEKKINKIVDRDSFAGILQLDAPFSYQWIVENITALQWMYDLLEDDLSRETMVAFINQKISTDYKYLRQVKQEYQYFEKEIIDLSEKEVFVDCGAYNGDSAVSFIEALKRRGILSYKKIISFEPDTVNYKNLRERNLENHRCICKGCGIKKETLRFSMGDTSSAISVNGNLFIEVDTIDNLLMNEEVTMIKMDIEGAELDALKGAKEIIQKNMPKLAICVYHKREDLWTIAEYIYSLVPSYKFYMRAYEETATELVLYAIP